MSTSSITTVVTTGEPVQVGDIISVGSDGLAYFALQPGTPNALFSPISQQTEDDEINSLTTTTFPAINANADTNHVGMASIALSNGNVANIFTASNIVQLSIQAPSGSLIATQKLSPSNNVNFSVAVAQLVNGNIAVAYQSASTASVMMALLDQNGNILIAPKVIETTTQGGAVAIAALANGSYVVCYALDANKNPKFQIFNATGATTNAGVTVNNSNNAINNNQSIDVVGLVGGGFVIVYASTDLTAGHVYARIYNNAGTALGISKEVGQAQPAGLNGSLLTAISLTTGGFAVASYGGTGPGFQMNIFDASGLIQGSTIILDPFDQEYQPNRIALAQLANSNIGVIWRGSQFACSAVYSITGAVISPKLNYGVYNGSVAIAATLTGAVLALQGTNGLDVATVDSSLFGDITNTTLSGGVLCSAITVEPVISPLGTGATSLIAGVGATHIEVGVFNSYTIPQRTPIGVSTQNVAADQPLTVQIEGTVTLRKEFTQPYSINANGFTIPGQKMFIVGNTAVLHGIQS